MNWLKKRNALTCICFGLLVSCGQNYDEGSHPPPIPPPAQAAVPASHPPVSDAKPSASSGALMASGTIRIAPSLADRVPSQGVLYIVARPAPSGGPPLAIRRLEIPEFPFEYRLMQSDSGMMMGSELNVDELDALYIVAKIDLDGSVGAAQPGDMEGACPQNPVAPGSTDADIVIDVIH